MLFSHQVNVNARDVILLTGEAFPSVDGDLHGTSGSLHTALDRARLYNCKIKEALRGRDSQMEYEIRQVGDVAVLDLSGRITFHELSALEPDGTILRKLVRELLAAGHRKVLLNLAKVSHIDSSGVNELVRASATVRSQGGQLRIANSSVPVREIFQVTKLDTILDMSLDEATALQSF